jgi:hypothetical protein
MDGSTLVGGVDGVFGLFYNAKTHGYMEYNLIDNERNI